MLPEVCKIYSQKPVILSLTEKPVATEIGAKVTTHILLHLPLAAATI